MNENTFGLSDKTVLLTGPNSMIGRAIATTLAETGANLALVDKNEEKTRRLANEIMERREINDKFGRAAAIVSDVSKLHHVQDIVGKAAETFGGIDIYVDALTVSRKIFFDSDALTEEFDRIVDVNLKAPFLISKEVLPYLKNRRRSRVIYLIPSLAKWGMTGESLSASTRTNLSHLTRVLSRETLDAPVTINCVSIGPTEDYLLDQNPGSASVQDILEDMKQKNEAIDLADPMEVAQVVRFLASSLSSAINGQTIDTGNPL